jgi:hypothetical protein
MDWALVDELKTLWGAPRNNADAKPAPSTNPSDQAPAFPLRICRRNRIRQFSLTSEGT